MTKAKLKTCKNCGKKYEPSRPLQVACSMKCGVEHVYKLKEKKQSESLKESKSVNKVKREQLKSLSDYKNELQKHVNLIARLIDINCPCISSGRSVGKMAGGHRFSVGAFDNLRFNLLNIWQQSFADNTYKSGNADGFDSTLKGYLIYDEVHALNAKYPFIKLQKPDLAEKIVIAKEIIKEIKLFNKEYTECRRLPYLRVELRRQYNSELGIYL